MNEKKLLTPTGREFLASCAYRLPLPAYQRLVEFCKMRGTSMSAFSRDAVVAALARIENGVDDEP